MAGILDGIDQRTNLAGQNRLELLLFRLHSRQRFGINVFKVQEVIRCPQLTQLPGAHPAVCGIANLRGKTISIIDLSMAIGNPPLGDNKERYIILAEYNRRVQGFLVGRPMPADDAHELAIRAVGGEEVSSRTESPDPVPSASA